MERRCLLYIHTSKMRARAARSGTPKQISRSKRPALLSAESRSLGRLVAPITTTGFPPVFSIVSESMHVSSCTRTEGDNRVANRTHGTGDCFQIRVKEEGALRVVRNPEYGGRQNVKKIDMQKRNSTSTPRRVFPRVLQIEG